MRRRGQLPSPYPPGPRARAGGGALIQSHRNPLRQSERSRLTVPIATRRPAVDLPEDGISALTAQTPPLLSSPHAPVAELVDAPDSKSGGGNIVLVRVRPGAPVQLCRFIGKRYQNAPDANSRSKVCVKRHVYARPLRNCTLCK